MNSNLKPESQFPHSRHISVAPAIRNRKAHLSNIWVFDSPKNSCRFIIQGDVAFMHTILMEGDLSISRYDLNPPPVSASIDGEIRQTILDAIVYFADGLVEWWEFKRAEESGPDRSGRARPQLSAQSQAASQAGLTYRVKTEIDLHGKEVLFDNWLHLCAAITRARNQSMFREARILETRLDMHGTVTLSSLMEESDCDPAMMLATVAKLLQQGLIYTELTKDFISRNSVISRRTT